MKNIILDGQTYNGISEVSLPISGGTALFKDKDEIVEPTGSLSITANGTYDVTDKASAVVNVPAPEINLQQKTATTNGDVVADEGYDGLSKVIVNVSGDVPTLVTKEISANGTYNASADDADGYSSVTVAVPTPEVNLQDKTITTNGTYSADEGYDGLGEVIVNVSGGGGLPLPTHATSRTITVEETVGDNSGGAFSACNALNLAAHEVAYLIDEQTAEAQLLYVFAESTSKYHVLRYRNSAVQYTAVTSDAAAGGIVAGTRYIVVTWA